MILPPLVFPAAIAVLTMFGNKLARLVVEHFKPRLMFPRELTRVELRLVLYTFQKNDLE